MELWIRSQDKEKLIKCNDIAISTDSEDGKTIGYKIVGYFDKNTEYEELGFYSSKTRALEIIDEIQSKLNCNKFLLKPKTCLLSKDDIIREKNWLEELNNINLITENSLCSIEPIGNSISVYEMPEK